MQVPALLCILTLLGHCQSWGSFSTSPPGSGCASKGLSFPWDISKKQVQSFAGVWGVAWLHSELQLERGVERQENE